MENDDEFLVLGFCLCDAKFFPRRGQKKYRDSPQEIQKILGKCDTLKPTQRGHKVWTEGSVCLIHFETLKYTQKNNLKHHWQLS